MGQLFLEDIFESGHFVGYESSGLLILEGADFSLVILDLLVDVLQLLLDDIGRGLLLDKFVLLLRGGCLPLLLLEHLVYFDDFVLQLAVALF
jgi:hypothetical protein